MIDRMIEFIKAAVVFAKLFSHGTKSLNTSYIHRSQNSSPLDKLNSHATPNYVQSYARTSHNRTRTRTREFQSRLKIPRTRLRALPKQGRRRRRHVRVTAPLFFGNPSYDDARARPDNSHTGHVPSSRCTRI